VNFTDATGVTNNFLHYLFSQLNITLNGVNIMQGSEHYHYSSYLETLTIYGTDAAATYLSNAYWYLDTGDMQPAGPWAEKLTATANRVFITRCHRLGTSGEVHLFDRLHIHICNVLLYLLPGFRLQIRLTKARPSFYLMNKSVDSKMVFKFLDSQLLVRRDRPNPA